MIEKRPALGKGLSALIPDVPETPRHAPFEVDIDLLAPNEQQPRAQMDDGRLEELTRSIRANGLRRNPRSSGSIDPAASPAYRRAMPTPR